MTGYLKFRRLYQREARIGDLLTGLKTLTLVSLFGGMMCDIDREILRLFYFGWV